MNLIVSIIIPWSGGPVGGLESAIDALALQTEPYEVLVVAPLDVAETTGLGRPAVRSVRSPQKGAGAQLAAGAAQAVGDVLLFLWPDVRLPSGCLASIRRNLSLLPQTIGGSFHVHFDHSGRSPRMVEQLLAWLRYRGYYGARSAIFVRRVEYVALVATSPGRQLTGLRLALRMEKLGPTLFLPDTVTAPWLSLL